MNWKKKRARWRRQAANYRGSSPMKDKRLYIEGWDYSMIRVRGDASLHVVSMHAFMAMTKKQKRHTIAEMKRMLGDE